MGEIMSKHTPGEWKLDPARNDLGRKDEIYSGDIKTGTTICILESGNRFDAHVIAASLKMLAALEGLGCVCLMGIGHPQVSEHSPECRAVRDAIAAAKGESR